MEFKDFPMLSADVLALSTDESVDALQDGQAIFLQRYQDDWLAVQGDVRIRVNCAKADAEIFGRLALRDQTRWLLTGTKKNKLLVQYCAPVEVTAMQLELGVDELLAEDLHAKREIAGSTVELACRWFAEHFVVQGLAEGDWLTVARFSNTATKGGFQLLGNGWRADVERRQDGSYLLKRVNRHTHRDGAFSILLGQFEFKDASVAAALGSASQQALLSAALRDNASYLELWNLYNDKEWQRALEQAESLGSLAYAECHGFQEGRGNAWRLIPKSQEQYQAFRERWRDLELSSNDQFDLGDQRPDWLEELSSEKAQRTANAPRGTIRFEPDCVIFKQAAGKTNIRPKAGEGWLYLSLAGQRSMGKRRLAAKQSIDSGKRLPQLKWLLEGVAVPAARRRPISGLTPYVLESFKGGKPTEKQALALDCALNTPDLAIIIGPPGTGKTQVIAALQRCLGERAEKQNIAAQVLVSSFQHDAVDNALERSDVFGLPGARVGGKHGESDQAALIEPWLERQAAHLHRKIAQEYSRFPELEQLRAISARLALARVASTGPAQQADEFQRLLHDLRELEQSGLALPPRLESHFEEYIDTLAGQAPATAAGGLPPSQLLRRIRALRVEVAAFTDDGGERAWDLLSWLKRHEKGVAPELLRLLEELADSSHVEPATLQALKIWKDLLLDQHLPDYRPAALKRQVDPDGLALLDEVDRYLEDRMAKRKQGVAWVLEQLVDSLESDRSAARAVVNEYSMVVGATCQQAAGKQMEMLKEVSTSSNSDIEFDTVVIDEAARANPLDLFIPMSMAKRRIVLVGDDRQLPHMLEPDIEGQLQEEHELTELQLAAFRSSLFERMRVKLQDLEKQDSIRRVVMLDTQFRMHPVLGNFVSKHFYECENLGVLHSGRPAEAFVFSQELLSRLGPLAESYRGHVCQWIDVPAVQGRDQRRGTSRVREIEAQRIADEVVKLMQAGGEALSVGIITFYAAQRDLIMEKLAQQKIDGTPLMVKREGGYEPHEQFKLTRKVQADGSVVAEERLRVGSVDAFQGKEFDVVLLSCVRSFQPNRSVRAAASEGGERELQLNRQFGFLRLPNRMNVAMSRQRQMLICVGDAALASNPDAQEAVPALAAFYQLCGGEHGCIR